MFQSFHDNEQFEEIGNGLANVKQIVIILTSSKMESDIVKSYEFGANGFVVKLIEFTDFVETIKVPGYFWAIINTSANRI